MADRVAVSQRRRLSDVGLLVAGLALGCTDTPTDTATFTVGGTVSGLMGTGLMLRNNGGDELAVTANGLVTFATPVASGAAYGVTVLTQPSGPAQTCGVLHGSGTVSHANVTTVEIGCAINLYSVGGTVSGLSGSGLVLRNNGGDELAVSANGLVTFATPLASGAAYSVTVLHQPTDPEQTCFVTGGSGAVADADVTTVDVACYLTGAASPLQVSSPVPEPSASSVVASRFSGSVVYVSLPPGAIPNGVKATIRDLRTGNSVTAAMIDGGFDPVPLPAVVGDSLSIAIQTGGGGGPSFLSVVAGGKRPGVVRTDPPTYKTDVPLNGLIVIVFSEPIDPATLTGSTVQLKQGTTLVPGQLAFADATHLQATFTPDTLLAGESDYELTVTQGIIGVSGQPLDSVVTVAFTTAPPTTGTIRVTVTTTGTDLPPWYNFVLDQGGSSLYSGDVLPNGSEMLAVAPGTYRVALHQVSWGSLYPVNNCNSNFVSATVAAGALTDVAFSVTCVAIPPGTIQVTVGTTGTDAPASYNLVAYEVWTYETPHTSIPSNGTASLLVPPGYYKVSPRLPVNCTLQGNEGNVVRTIDPGSTTSITFSVTCEPPATLRVTASTTGPNAPATFTVDVDPTSSGSWGYRMIVSSNGTDSAILRAGSHTVKLLEPLNCFVGPNPVSVTLTAGATTDVGFTVVCQ